jgi:hypothetical protein
MKSFKESIVGIAIGRLSKKKSEKFILILLSNFNIIKLNKDLEIIWNNNFLKNDNKDKIILNAIIRIIPYRIHYKDEGMIIISIKLKHLNDEKFFYYAITVLIFF